MATKAALLACLASTLWMTGVIVFVQVVHYPLFDRVGASAFAGYHSEHVRRTTAVVLAPMVVELLTSVLLVYRPPAGSPPWLAWAGLAAAAVTWGATGLLSVPLHDHLARGFDPGRTRSLVETNAVRVAGWVGHSTVLLAMTAGSLR